MRVVSPRLLAWIARAGFIGHPWRGGAVGRVKRARASGRDGQCDDRALLRQPLGGGLAVVIAVGLLCIAANVYGLRPTIGGDSRSVPPSALQGSGLAILHGTIGFLARSLVFILMFSHFRRVAYQCTRGDRIRRRSAYAAFGTVPESTFIDCGRWAVGVRIIGRVGGLRPGRKPAVLRRTGEDEQDERRILNHVCASKLWRRAAQPCRELLAGNDGADGEDGAPGEPPFVPLAPARVHDQLLSRDFLHSLQIRGRQHAAAGETRAGKVKSPTHSLHCILIKTVLLGRTHVPPVTILKTVACPILFRPHSRTVIAECHVFVPCFHENVRATHIVAPKELCGEGPVVSVEPNGVGGEVLWLMCSRPLRKASRRAEASR